MLNVTGISASYVAQISPCIVLMFFCNLMNIYLSGKSSDFLSVIDGTNTSVTYVVQKLLHVYIPLLANHRRNQYLNGRYINSYIHA
jgi:hypothetical protein